MLPKLTSHGSHFVIALTLAKLALSCREHSIGFVFVCTAIVAFGPIFSEKNKKQKRLMRALKSDKCCNNLPLTTVFGLRSSCGRLEMGGFDGRCKNDRLSSNYLLKANIQDINNEGFARILSRDRIYRIYINRSTLYLPLLSRTLPSVVVY